MGCLSLPFCWYQATYACVCPGRVEQKRVFIEKYEKAIEPYTRGKGINWELQISNEDVSRAYHFYTLFFASLTSLWLLKPNSLVCSLFSGTKTVFAPRLSIRNHSEGGKN